MRVLDSSSLLMQTLGSSDDSYPREKPGLSSRYSALAQAERVIAGIWGMNQWMAAVSLSNAHIIIK